MGTNYYLHSPACPYCGRGDEPRHIGKSSGGWCFSLHVYPEDNINDLPDWEKMWADRGVKIRDEFGVEITLGKMKKIITEREWPGKAEKYHNWYEENDAEPGPNNLARAKIGRGCIGHGAGTWDLITGEFS